MTGTAGDGKTYYRRKDWEHFGGDSDLWNLGRKIVSLNLPASQRVVTIVKDLSELTREEKDGVLAGLDQSVATPERDHVYLVAANDPQLLASWRDWAEPRGQDAHRIFCIVEDMQDAAARIARLDGFPRVHLRAVSWGRDESAQANARREASRSRKLRSCPKPTACNPQSAPSHAVHRQISFLPKIAF